MTAADDKHSISIMLRDGLQAISIDIRDMRTSQAAMQLEFRTLAVGMATVLTKVESLEKQITKVDSMESRMHELETRFSLMEVQAESMPDMANRLKVLEEAKAKIVWTGALTLLMVQLAIEIGKILI